MICCHLDEQVKTVPLSSDNESPEEKTDKKAHMGPPTDAALVGVPLAAGEITKAILESTAIH